MPLFHSNALMAGWAPALAAGATVALRERFSASQFLPDVRRYGVTYFNYVGKPLSYILATPELPDDADNPLRRVFGNEAAEADVARFAERFGCTVQDAYGSTEGGASVQRTPDTPRGALGRALPGTLIINPETGEECPRAVFDERRPAAQRRRGHRRDGQPDRWRPGSRATGATPRPRRPGCATAGTGPATSPTGTRTTSSTSPAGTSTGCGWTGRTSPPPRSRRSSSATPTWCWPRSTPCPTPWSATR